MFAGFRACFCLLGHYRLDRYGACVVCPRGYDCVNGTVTLSSGFYWRWSDNHTKQMYTAFKDNLQITDDSFNLSLTKYSTLLPTSYACPVAESCLGSLDSTCSQGYEGPLCGVCSQGYFKLLTKCQKCPSLPSIAVQFVIVFALVSLVAFLTLRDRKKEEHAQRSVADILLYSKVQNSCQLLPSNVWNIERILVREMAWSCDYYRQLRGDVTTKPFSNRTYPLP